MPEALPALLRRVRACTLCAPHLPLGPRPVLQAAASARILVAGQAPGPHTIALPHPSPRNNGWLQRNPWFEAEVLPQVRAHVADVLAENTSEKGL